MVEAVADAVRLDILRSKNMQLLIPSPYPFVMLFDGHFQAPILDVFMKTGIGHNLDASLRWRTKCATVI